MRQVEIPGPAREPLRRMMLEAADKKRAADEAELRVGLFVEGLCNGLGEPFPPAMIDADEGQLIWHDEDSVPPE